MPEKLFAGLDIDAFAKLFLVDEKGNVRKVTHRDWLKILDALGADAGEMVVVTLARESDNQPGK